MSERKRLSDDDLAFYLARPGLLLRHDIEKVIRELQERRASSPPLLEVFKTAAVWMRNGDYDHRGGLIEMDRVAGLMESAIAEWSASSPAAGRDAVIEALKHAAEVNLCAIADMEFLKMAVERDDPKSEILLRIRLHSESETRAELAARAALKETPNGN